MASRRRLKKTVNYVIDDLFLECLITSKYKKEKGNEINDIMLDLLSLQEDFVKRISHTEPKNAKVFYKNFYTDFNAQVADVLKRLDAVD